MAVPHSGGMPGTILSDAAVDDLTANTLTVSGTATLTTALAGELGGTTAAAIVGASHSGSTHAATRAAAEATAAAALSAHGSNTNTHGTLAALTVTGALNADSVRVSGGQWFDVTHPDFGAVGDGVTDDTAAIQAAINAAGAYDTVFFPLLTFKITGTLTIPRAIRLLGASAYPNWYSQGTVISMATANTTAISATAFETLVQIENLQILGPGGATSGRGIYSSANVVLHQVKVKGFYDGVYIDDSLGEPPGSAFYNHITQCWIDNNARAGLLLRSKTNNTTVSETYFAFQPYGILADGGGYGIRINECSFELHSIAGISIDGSGGGSGQSTSGVKISGCYFEQLLAGGSASADILIGPNTKVYGVLIEGGFHVQSNIATLWHIDINQADGVTLLGNFFGDGSEAGAYRANATNSSNVRLINNVTTGSTTSIAASSRELTSGQLVGVSIKQETPGTTITTTTAMDVAGATLTIVPVVTETWVVTVAWDFRWSAASAGTLLVGEVSFTGTGTKTAPSAVLQGDVVTRQTVSQVGLITGVAPGPHTIKLQALKTVAAGTAATEGTTTLRVERYVE